MPGSYSEICSSRVHPRTNFNLCCHLTVRLTNVCALIHTLLDLPACLVVSSYPTIDFCIDFHLKSSLLDKLLNFLVLDQL